MQIFWHLAKKVSGSANYSVAPHGNQSCQSFTKAGVLRLTFDGVNESLSHECLRLRRKSARSATAEPSAHGHSALPARYFGRDM